MKTPRTNLEHNGLTLIELLVVIAIIVILALLLFPTSGGHRQARTLICMNNQRQMAIALTMFQDDHDGKYPWEVSVTNNGSFEPVSNGSVSAHYLSSIGTYVGNRTEILICPTDKTRLAATNFFTLTNSNISYFLNLDTITNMNSILAGDRNLKVNLQPINAGIFVQTTNTTLKWAEGFHGSQNKPYGIIVFTDGHAERIQQEYLNRKLQSQPLTTNRFCFP